MLKRILIFVLAFSAIFVVSACTETVGSIDIELSITDTEVTMVQGDSFTVSPVTNDKAGVAFTIDNTNIISITSSGIVTALSEGTATVTIKSVTDDSKELEVHFTVEKLIEIEINRDYYVLTVEGTVIIDLTANDDLTYSSYNPNIATVNDEGLLTGIGYGLATIKIISDSDSAIFKEISVQVYKQTTEIEITGNDVIFVGMESLLEISPSPAGALSDVTWEIADESIATIDEFGLATGVAAGTTTVVAKSVFDDTIADTFNIEVVSISVVDKSKTTGETYDFNGQLLNYGEVLFSTIQDAIDAAQPNTHIYVVDGTYLDDFVINKDGIIIEGLDSAAIINAELLLASDNITIRNLSFIGRSMISNSIDVTNITIADNTVLITTANTNGEFISLKGITTLNVINNDLNVGSNCAISIFDFLGGTFLIKDNIISGDNGIIIDADNEYLLTTAINIMWNTISITGTAISIDLEATTGQKDIEAYARFNKISNYTTAVTVNSGNAIDFTLNYWGVVDVDLSKFINVDPYYIQGNYDDPLDMLTEVQYNPSLPVIIEILNPIDEIMIGESHTFEYIIFPLELQNAPIKFITGNPTVVAINQSGVITPLVSGNASIQVRSGIVSSIRTQTEFSVITTPGIEMTTDHVMNDLIIGDTFNLGYELFPYTIATEIVTITSSNPLIATVDSAGLVTTHAAGEVTFRAALDSDSTVFVDYKIIVYSGLDSTNLLDYLTTKQVTYSEIHEWIAYGFAFNYNDRRAESVSRYYFGDIVINTSKLIPVFEGIRPGEPMDPLPAGVPEYNDEDIYWVVVHDTASTAGGSNAIAHANYLFNATVSGTKLWVSWHYTIDDHDVYQHLPENERGYHAGDGSSNPGEGSYFGGGNRNGIGIEMSVNQDGDMYRTWQRTAKLVTEILVRNNLPLSQQAYHNDFSGKDCPNTLRNAGLIPLFEEFLEIEYYVATNHPTAVVTLVSDNPDYLDNHGRIIQIPQRAMTVSYTITVTEDGVTESRTFSTYLPGTVR